MNTFLVIILIIIAFIMLKIVLEISNLNAYLRIQNVILIDKKTSSWRDRQRLWELAMEYEKSGLYSKSNYY